jgi:hypothetical protein
VVSAQWSPSALWGRYPALFECDIPMKVDWDSGTDYMASLVKFDPDGLFPADTHEEAHYRSPYPGL